MLASKYGPWIEAPKVDGSELRLFCVPPVGMGSSCFHAWAPQLPGVELMPLELPGRGVRMAERLCCDSLVHLAQQALDGIGRGIFESHPFVFFGHSFGAWLAYEMVQELRRRGWPLPLKLYVSANRAPQLHGLRHDPDRTQPALAGLDEESFWHHFERRYGVNPDLQSPYIRAHVRNILQGDFQLLETYGPSSLEKLPLPLCGLCAKGDGRCRPQQLSAWAEVAETFEERWFEDVRQPHFWATEHRYIVDNPSSLLRFLSADLPIVGSGDFSPGSGIPGPLPAVPVEASEQPKGCGIL